MRLALFGDSICAGQYIPQHLTWATALSKALGAVHGNDFVFVNPSISGDTTRIALERMPHAIQVINPDVLLIQFGLNDCNRWDSDNGVPRVSLDSYRANLHEMINRASACGVGTVYLCTNHPSTKSASFQNDLRGYNCVVRQVSQDRAHYVILIDHEKFWEEEIKKGAELSKLLLPDGIHLSIEGHQLYEKLVIPTLLATS